MMAEKSLEMEIFMYDVSLRRKDKVIDEIYIEEAIKGIQYQIRDSTKLYFDENPFFQELP